MSDCLERFRQHLWNESRLFLVKDNKTRTTGIEPMTTAQIWLMSVWLLLFNCLSVSAYDAVADDSLWVAKDFAGGKQCEPTSKYDPPDVKRLLEKAGIPVYETRVESLFVCMACSICPDYAARHYARIQQNKADIAQQFGFNPKQPPKIK
jgi:hypothetical protein